MAYNLPYNFEALDALIADVLLEMGLEFERDEVASGYAIYTVRHNASEQSGVSIRKMLGDRSEIYIADEQVFNWITGRLKFEDEHAKALRGISPPNVSPEINARREKVLAMRLSKEPIKKIAEELTVSIGTVNTDILALREAGRLPKKANRAKVQQKSR